MKNALITVLAIATLCLSVLAWRQSRELAEARQAGLNSNERADLQRKLWELQKSNRALQDQVAALQGGREPAGPGGARGDASFGPGGPGGRGRGGQQAAALREVLAKPEVQAMVNTARGALVDSQYAALFRSLNLSPDQAAKLKALLLERQNTMQDVMSAAREQGVDPRADREGLRKVVTDAQNAVNDSIRALLGDTAYDQFNNYEQSMPQRNVVNALQQRLTDSGNPLSPTQADQLVQILASNAPARTSADAGAPPPPDGFGPRGGGEFGGRMMMGGLGGTGAGLAAAIGPGSATITSQAVDASSAVLTPPQVTALQQLQQQQQTARQLEQVIRNATEPPPPADAGARKRPGG